MKYLNNDIYQKACFPGGKENEEKWHELYNQYLQEFNKTSSRLPKTFLKEFEKQHMHDYIVKNILIIRKELKSKFHYDLTLCLTRYNHINDHLLKFTNVKKLKGSLFTNYTNSFYDWIHSEILAVDEKRMSIEILFNKEDKLYFEFSRLHYKGNL